MRDKNSTRKNVLLDAAKKVFMEKGYDGASVDDVATEAGAAKSLLYYYFSSKEEILLELMKRSVENTVGILAEERKNNKMPNTTDELFNRASDLIKKENDVLKIAVGEMLKKDCKTNLICDMTMAIFDEYDDVFEFTNKEKVLFILFAVKIIVYDALKDSIKKNLSIEENELEFIFKSNIEPIFEELIKK